MSFSQNSKVGNTHPVYPRLLMLTSNAFNHLSGGGVTFTNLFHGWPKDKIACVHRDKIEPATEICSRYYKLGRKEFKWMFPFSSADFFGGQEKIEKGLENAKASAQDGSKTRMLKFAQKVVQLIFGDRIPIKAAVSGELRTWIKQFNPEIIYTILGSLEWMELVRKVSREFNIPVVVHMMDDWPAVMYRRGIFGPFMRRRMESELQKMMKEAAACLSICDAMSEAYEKRYGRKFLAFHNALPAENWLKKARKDWASSSPFTVVYAGALMPDSQLSSVKDVAEAVADLQREGRDIEFQIYSPWYFANPYRGELEREGYVKVFEMPETMDIEELFAHADLLLLPVNFDKASRKYIRYSMPTKVPAYMFSGTPTLAYGPPEVASIGYAFKSGWAYCVTHRNKSALREAIKKLAYDEHLRKNLALNAQRLAQDRHDRKEVGTEFQKVLINAAIQTLSMFKAEHL